MYEFLQFKPSICVEVNRKIRKHKIEYFVTALSQIEPNLIANNVIITIPVPSDADSPQFKSSIGKVQYKPEIDAFTWTIKQFQGKSHSLWANFGLCPFVGE